MADAHRISWAPHIRTGYYAVRFGIGPPRGRNAEPRYLRGRPFTRRRPRKRSDYRSDYVKARLGRTAGSSGLWVRFNEKVLAKYTEKCRRPGLGMSIAGTDLQKGKQSHTR